MFHDIRWFLTVAAGVAVKLLLTEVQSWRRAVASASAAFLMAIVFTDPLLAWLGPGWPPDRYQIAVGVVLALFGENVVRRLMDATGSPTLLTDMIKAWRGK